MTPLYPRSIDRLYDLLAQQATETLSPSEEIELNELLATWPHIEADAMELAASAALAASLPAKPESVSTALRQRLDAGAAAFFDEPDPVRPKETRRPSRLATAGWLVAACLLIATGVLGWKLAESTRPTQTESLATQRERLLASGGKTFRSDGKGRVTGDVVWDAASQSGFMQLAGIPANDPNRLQYQLWIVDPGRPHKEPVDGGVFDVGPDGTALVPIRPALTLKSPSLFAITEEPPGGVVVSERGQRGEFVVVMGN